MIKYCKTFTLFLVFAGLLSSCGNNSDNFSIKGKLDNISGNYFYAAREVNNSLLIDTVSIDKDGKFAFSGEVDTLTVMSLYFNKNTKSTYILIDKGWSVNLEGDVLYTDLITTKGGNINNDLTQFKKDNHELIKSRAEISSTLESGVNNGMDNSKQIAELTTVNFELANLAADYVKQNPDKIASVMLINTFFKNESTIPRLDENLDLLRDDARLFPITIALRSYSKRVKNSLVGELAPSIIEKDLDGNNIRLFSYRGKYLVLSFAATTCETCNLERKEMVEMYNKLKNNNRNIDFLTVMLDTEIEPLTQSAVDSVDWTIIPVEGSWSTDAVSKYNIGEIPYNILISPQGIILARDISANRIEILLNEKEGKN